MDFANEHKIAVNLVSLVCSSLSFPDLTNNITVIWNNRFTWKMGEAWWDGKTGVVKLSKPLWPRATEVQRREIVIHEICHIIVGAKYGSAGWGKPHGKIWKDLMRQCGEKGDRTHTVDRTGLKRTGKKHRIECGCHVWFVGSTIYKRLISGKKYICPKCSGRCYVV
jgi:predicted SprT family Zn-dependent metalloprotease